MSAGITAQLLTYPLDTVSARMKINLGERQYKSVPHALVAIRRKDGMVGLYRGSVPTARSWRACVQHGASPPSRRTAQPAAHRNGCSRTCL